MNVPLNPFEFVIACLATYRLSRLLVIEDGPFDLIYKLRIKTGIEYDHKGEVISYPSWNPLHCIWCTSIYISGLVFFTWSLLSYFWIILAISAVASMVQRIEKWL